MFLLGEDLSLQEFDLGALIFQYIERLNSSPEFYLSKELSEIGGYSGEESFRHRVAGFLGVPGNLITCTIPHGLAVASLLSSENDLQVPGDDVGSVYDNELHLRDIGHCASSVGHLQMDKVFRTPGASLYLRRLVIDLFDSISLSPMLIYPLLPYLGRDESGSRHVDWNTRSWRYRKYVDLDDPRAPTLYGKTRDWAVNDLPRERSSLSPEPQDVSLYY